nr:gfo/Idh/MocA family oxidoreductase [Verrucomicrobiota bacterium]
RMAHTTLATIMGRMAAYTGQEITWEQALHSQEKLMPGEMSWETKVELPPPPMPGQTKFS